MTLVASYSWVSQCMKLLMTTHECLLVLFGAHECSVAWFWNKQKMLSFKMTSLWYFDNISFHISPNNINRIFLKSTRNGLLKNALYEISRLLGSPKIQKTKVAYVLWDTLYTISHCLFSLILGNIAMNIQIGLIRNALIYGNQTTARLTKLEKCF